MDYLILIVLSVGSLALGFRLGTKSTISYIEPVALRSERGRAEDRNIFLQVACRELANFLIWHNEARFVNFYLSLHKELKSISRWKNENLQREYDLIAAKYPQYSDFDTIAIKAYVLYPDGLSWKHIIEVEQVLRDIMVFRTILIATDVNWKHLAVTTGFDENETTHLLEYSQIVSDTKLKMHIDRAMEAFYAFQRDGTETAYENRWYLIKRIDHFAEGRYGIYVKSSNEYAIHSFFVFDDPLPDGSPKISYGYYRSDAQFESEIPLQYSREMIDWSQGSQSRGDAPNTCQRRTS